ncbi:TetR/AcrR family transcriptional regulator [Rhodococcus erythropolis]|uniref:TetR/AcrR family transcriptional regulator n=1 Tax=Rhodococcus erythropolis TaxID=1833 RepID=UPI0036725169
MTKQAEDRREDILNATLNLIEEKGVDQLRAADLAKVLGVSSGLIFYHFDNLQTLVTSAVSYATERQMAYLARLIEESGDDLIGRLYAVLHEYGPTGSAFGWRLWIECWSASLRDVELRKVVQSLDAEWRGLITDIIDEGVRTGVFDCPDPAAAALRLTALLDGLAVQYVVFDRAVTIIQIGDAMNLTLSRDLGI